MNNLHQMQNYLDILKIRQKASKRDTIFFWRYFFDNDPCHRRIWTGYRTGE